VSPALLRVAGDERLARLVTAGHDAAFAALYDRYRDVLVRYCRSVVRDEQDALDAFQSTMLNALRALREDRRRAPVRPWLFRIAHNEAISVLRRRPAAEPLDPERVATVDVQRAAEDREELGALLADVGALTVHQRSALLLRELGGLGYDEVAGVLDTTPLAARQAVFAARASLHEQRAGRELPCVAVQRQLSDGDRRAARSRAVRAHLRGCDDCRGFATAIGRRRRAVALLPVPSFAGSGLLASILDGAGGPAGAGGSTVGVGVAAKAAVALTAAVVATNAAPTEPTQRRTMTTATASTTASASSHQPSKSRATAKRTARAADRTRATPGIRPVALRTATGPAPRVARATYVRVSAPVPKPTVRPAPARHDAPDATAPEIDDRSFGHGRPVRAQADFADAPRNAGRGACAHDRRPEPAATAPATAEPVAPATPSAPAPAATSAEPAPQV
jgi:RNA polymerase sigma factor (sigma-70 family)